MDKRGITRRGRATGATAFARALGWETAKTQQDFRRWTKDGALPDYNETWDMLEALGWIQVEARPIDEAEDLVRRLNAGETFPRRRLERAATAAERVAADLLRLAERLREAAQVARQAR